MKRFLIIIFTGLKWCNLLSAKIINIDNKLNLDVPQNHKLLKVDKDFDILDKKRLIQICGHYLFSNIGFKKIKPDIDDVVISEIKYKLGELYNDIR